MPEIVRLGGVIRSLGWGWLPKVDGRAPPLLAAVARWADAAGVADGGRVDALGGTVARIEGAALVAGDALAARLADPTSSVAVVRGAAGTAHVVAPGALVRRLAQALLGGPDELAAPRPATPAEQAVLAYAVAAWVERLGAAVEVEPSELAGPLVAARLREALVIDVVVTGAVGAGRRAVTSRVAVVASPQLALAPRRAPLAALRAARGGWLDDAAAALAIVVATARLDAAALAGLAPRDVIVVDRVGGAGAVRLRLGRGGFAATLAPSDGRVTVAAGYQRDPMEEHLGDDATADLTIVIGDLRLSVRTLLELAPGQVLALGRPPGGDVELRVGDRLIGRGELVDVDGELGVRVLTVAAAAPAPAPAPG